MEDRLDYLGGLLERSAPDLVRDHSPMREAQYMTRAAAEYFIGVLGAFLKKHAPREARDIIRPINGANTNTLAQFSAELESPAHRRAAMGSVSEEIAADIATRTIDTDALKEALHLAVAAGYTQRQILTMTERTIIEQSPRSR